MTHPANVSATATNTNAKPPAVGEQTGDRIYALASGSMCAGVAVLRVSGRNLSDVCAALALPCPLKPRYAHYVALRDAARGVTLDKALALFFPAPHSFTGEDVLELHLHGSRAVIESVMACLSALPACRLAEPGEFTKRAFLNGKMDLLQAEGLADLIDADTPLQQQQALSQLGGAASARYDAMRTTILRALALLEAYIDFPDEEIPETTMLEVASLCTALREDIATALGDAYQGERIRDGVRIALLGPPNAGKSSLLNALAKREAAIVSEIAGTTRDRIEVDLNLSGYLVRLIDTAGLRKETTDRIEAEGVRRALGAADEADIHLFVFDIMSIPESDDPIWQYLNEDSVMILNKADLHDGELPATIQGKKPIILSALRLDGMDGLLQSLTSMIQSRLEQRRSPLITRQRHREALNEAAQALRAFHRDAPLEIQAETLRRAAWCVGKITGKIEVDQLLDVIFREFCIGK